MHFSISAEAHSGANTSANISQAGLLLCSAACRLLAPRSFLQEGPFVLPSPLLLVDEESLRSPHLYARRARRRAIDSSSPLMFTTGAGCGGWNGFYVGNERLGP